MLRLIAIAGFALSISTSAQAITPAPLPQVDDMITQVAVGCGPGRTRIDGVCVARTTVRQTRRAVRRCVRWQGGLVLCTSERHALAVGPAWNRTPAPCFDAPRSSASFHRANFDDFAIADFQP